MTKESDNIKRMRLSKSNLHEPINPTKAISQQVIQESKYEYKWTYFTVPNSSSYPYWSPVLTWRVWKDILDPQGKSCVEFSLCRISLQET
jgi:hypothetical protein